MQSLDTTTTSSPRSVAPGRARTDKPDMRLVFGNPNLFKFNKILKGDDIVMVPGFFGPDANTSSYSKLMEEIADLKHEQEGMLKEGADNEDIDVAAWKWKQWHQVPGTHDIFTNPADGETFNMVVDRLCEYFNIRKDTVKFNWYRGQIAQPFHHDLAGAQKHNVTVGASFGTMRELAFVHNESNVKVNIPLPNNSAIAYGENVNLAWKHGVDHIQDSSTDKGGRISIYIHGVSRDVMEDK